MSRRTCLLLGLTGFAIAVAAGMYAPEYADVDDPYYAADVLGCLDPREEVAVDAAAKSEQEALIEITLRTVLISKLSPSHKQLAGHGFVKDVYRFFDAVQNDYDAHVMQTQSTVSTGQSFFLPASVARPKLADDGVTSVIVECGFKANGTPTLCKNGRIHIQFEAWLMSTDRAPIHAKGSFLVQNGQTCYVGGATCKMAGASPFEVPLLSQLPGIGDCFRVDSKYDAPVLFLATPKLVTGR